MSVSLHDIATALRKSGEILARLERRRRERELRKELARVEHNAAWHAELIKRAARMEDIDGAIAAAKAARTSRLEEEQLAEMAAALIRQGRRS